MDYEWGLNRGPLVPSQALLLSEPPDSLMAEDHRIVLIPKLTSKPAVSIFSNT